MIKYPKSIYLVTASSILGLCAGAPAAIAQTADDSSSARSNEIIVTATKRSQSIQDVPATITALSRTDLETRQVDSLTDLISQVPSLQVGYTYGSNMITLRGISTGLTGGFEDPSVAVHVNGVYQPRARNLNIALMDLERVEVLSGPQGTLYGRNATGGVVNYILRRPTETTEAEITGSVGNYQSYGLRGFVSGPISDTVGFRIAGLWKNREKGFIKNVLPGAPKSRFAEEEVAAIRGVLAFQPTDTLEIDLEGSFSSTHGSFQVTALAPSLNATRRAQQGVQPYRPRQVASNWPSLNRTKDYGATATVRWDLTDDMKLTSISAYQKYHNIFNTDGDFSGGTIQDINNQYKSNTYTQEVNLASELFDGRLSSIFGVFYFNDEVHQASQVFGNPFGGPVGQYFTATGLLKTRSLSFFTDQTLKITDRLRLIGGVRYNIDKKTTITRLSSGCPALEQVVDQKFTAWTPKGGFQFDLNSDMMLYGNYQKGFKAGGVGSGTCANAYEPETIEGIEAGIKTTFLDDRVRFNLAGYWYKYGNLQVQKTLGTAGGFAVQNAAKSKIKGIEASLNAEITRGLQLDLSGMVQSAKYTDFVNCNNRDFLGSCSALDPRPITDPARNQQLAGNWLNRAAPYSVNVGLQYTADVAGGELVLRGESYWSGKIRYNEFAPPALIQKAYSLQNAYVTYTPESEKFTVRLFAKNIANKDRFASAFFAGFVAQDVATWAEPRTFGAEVSVKFGPRSGN